ncbi:two-component sensor histidine kinase [Polaribacter pacificus]|uniref:histidine kinase n=1 Tax=Polaribacter pacificus TaxID=1775173 RepID=A0A917HZ05_9FLAO|nr:two-component sensor histidine kinase [Polaribacter pacificus]
MVKKYEEINELYKSKNYTKSLENALKLFEEIENTNENKRVKFLIASVIGNIFKETNNHDKSLKFYLKSYNLYENNLINVESGLNSINDLYIEYVNLLLRLGSSYQVLKNNDSAIYYYNKIENIQSLNNRIESIKALTYSNLSGIYLRDSLYERAKIYALKAVEIRKLNKNKISEAASLSNLASISLKQNKFEEAKEIYSKALNLIENDTTSLAVKYKESLYYNLAWTLFLLKDYMAYDFQEKSYLIKDNLRDQEMRRIVEDVYANYQVELVKNQVALKKAEERKTNYYLGALMLLILVVFGVIIYNYKLRQKNLKLNFEQNELAQQSQIERLKSETQIRILNATLDGKESERKEIAETLHDSVSTLLSSASLHLQASKNKFNGSTPLEIEKSQTIITEASQKIRDLSHTLVSSVLLKFGLKYSINEMGQKYSNSQIEIETSTKNINRYHQNFEIKVNNIIQEFVNNILKHSKATYALVQVEEKNKQLFIHIEDNGCGFDKDGVVKKDGLGINQIEARIQMMKGTFQIDSIKNQGTKIRICLPIIEKEEAILL